MTRAISLITIGALLGCTGMAFCLRYYDRYLIRPYDTLVSASFSESAAECLEIQPTSAYIVRFVRGTPTTVEITRQWNRDLIVGVGTMSKSQVSTIAYWFDQQKGHD